jgi:hypothetical protein
MVQRYATLPIPIGASLSFVDPDTEAVIGAAHVVSESPVLAKQTLAAGEKISLTLDNAPNGIANGMGLINNDPTQHGDGFVMQYNVVQQACSRGARSCRAETARRASRRVVYSTRDPRNHCQ